MSDEVDLTQFPDEQKAAVAATALQIAASLLPIGSGAATALLSALMPELSKDRIAQLEYLGTGVREHEKHLSVHDGSLVVKSIDDMVKHPAFRAAVLRATKIALRDPLRKKWEALRNGLLNVSSG